MKKKAIIVLCLALVFTLIGCGNNAQSSDEHNAEYQEGYTLATRPGIMTEKSKQPEMKNILHSFRVLLRPLLSRSCPITMHCREKRLRLFTSFRTDHFCFISRKT